MYDAHGAPPFFTYRRLLHTPMTIAAAGPEECERSGKDLRSKDNKIYALWEYETAERGNLPKS